MTKTKDKKQKGEYCRNCDEVLTKSQNPEYTYECIPCDEDFYAFEAVEHSVTK